MYSCAAQVTDFTSAAEVGLERHVAADKMNNYSRYYGKMKKKVRQCYVVLLRVIRSLRRNAIFEDCGLMFEANYKYRERRVLGEKALTSVCGCFCSFPGFSGLGRRFSQMGWSLGLRFLS